MILIISNCFNIRNFLFIIQEVAVIIKTCIVCIGIFVVDYFSTIDRSSVSTCNVTIEHTVHHHSLQVAAGGCHSVVPYNTAAIISAFNVGIVVAVDNT